MNTILVVDDDTTSLKLAQGILDSVYSVFTASSGMQALEYLGSHTPSLMLLDMDMPDMDGFEVLKRLQAKAEWAAIPIVFLTASSDPQNEARCLEAGAIDYVSKPFVPVVLLNRVRRVMELYGYRHKLESMVAEQSKLIISRTERIAAMQSSIIIGMANLIELRDNNTGRHVKNTQVYVAMLCSALKKRGLYADILTDEYMNDTIRAAPLHDVGKIKISDTILNKPGPLTEEEFEIIKNHTRYGASIVGDLLGEVEEPAYLAVVRDIALRHHERWDGTGYPDGIAGDNIPLCARIMALADVFDALYEDRVYKPGIRPLGACLDIIQKARGHQFDPVITDVFLSLEPQLKKYVGEKERLFA